MTLLESFSNATPVLASHLGALSSLNIDSSNGFHLEPGNIASLKEMVCRFDALSQIEKEQKGIN